MSLASPALRVPLRTAAALAAAAVGAPLGRPAAAQAPLTLPAALAEADSAAYPVRIALGDRDAARARALEPLAGVLPSTRVEAGWARTTDPLNAFGFLLRQRGVTPAAFDPAALNQPAGIGNWNAGLVAEVPLLNADAWVGRQAAGRGADAAGAAAAWTREGARLDVVRGWFGAVLADERVVTLEAALRSAEARVRQAESMARNGMVTRSDALVAAVEAGKVAAELADARARARLARRQLAVALGRPGDAVAEVTGALPSSTTVRGLADATLAVAGQMEGRADVQAATLGVEAAEADARRAAARWLPRLNGMGRLDWNNPSSPFAGQSAWTVGVMATWSPFDGGATIAQRGAAVARREQAAARREAAAAMAALEVARATEQLQVALERRAIAERSVGQADEALRIVGRKYEGGLATVAELFGAEALATGARLMLADARYRVVVAAAERRQALGLDVAAVATVTDAER